MDSQGRLVKLFWAVMAVLRASAVYLPTLLVGGAVPVTMMISSTLFFGKYIPYERREVSIAHTVLLLEAAVLSPAIMSLGGWGEFLAVFTMNLHFNLTLYCVCEYLTLSNRIRIRSDTANDS
jgi:hypothetical protein